MMGNKKGISIMIGYVLLVAFAVIIGAIVYTWIKTYVPADPLECPEDVSLFIKDYSYNCTSNLLELTIINNGKFNVGGYFIHATDSPDQTLAAIDLSKFHTSNIFEGVVKFSGTGDNALSPGSSSEVHSFNISSSEISEIYLIEITPVRWQEDDERQRFVSCGDSKIKQLIECS